MRIFRRSRSRGGIACSWTTSLRHGAYRRHGDGIGTRGRDEGEGFWRDRRVEVPGQPRYIIGTGRITQVGDPVHAGQGLVAGAYPDLPVDIRLAERIVRTGLVLD